MNRKKAEEFLSIGQEDSIIGTTPKGTTLVFARAGNRDIERIESMSDDELVRQFKSLDYVLFEYGQVSIYDLEVYTLMEMEIENRKLLDGEKDEGGNQ